MSWVGIISICETDSLWELLRQIIFWTSKSLMAAMKLKDSCSLEESYEKPEQHIKNQRHHFANKGPYSQSYILFCFVLFSSSHVWMWKLEHKEGWVKKNGFFKTVVLEKSFETPLDYNEIKPVNPKVKSTLNIQWKDWCWRWSSNTLAIWCKELIHWRRPWCWERLRAVEKRMTENEMVGWHHRLNGLEFEQTQGDSEGQGSLVSCSSYLQRVRLSNWTTTKCTSTN